MQSVNPYSGEIIRSYASDSDTQVDRRIALADHAFHTWRATPFAERAVRLRRVGHLLRDRKGELAALMADEMGKVLREGVGEIEKCAMCCDYYAEHARRLLADQVVSSDAAERYVAFDPLGVILAIMPWNFPFWQVFRFAAPSLMAGNAGVLKHASNVCGCAPAGSAVAASAGAALKKTVLELGGSDAYLVLEDAPLERAETCVQSRLINAGQSCIAAKRFIAVKPLYPQFLQRYVDAFEVIRYGAPKDDQSDIGPLARADLREHVHRQMQQGATRSSAARFRPGRAPATRRRCWAM